MDSILRIRARRPRKPCEHPSRSTGDARADRRFTNIHANLPLVLLIIGVSLLFVLAACVPLAAPMPTPPSGRPGIIWRDVTSPLFPTEWPPTPASTWVRYTFAYGQDFDLRDGERVSRPLTRTEWRTGGEQGPTVELSTVREPADTQGVVPLDPAARAVLETGPDVAAYSLQLTGLPEPGAPETAEMKAFYRAWFKYNGAFLSMIEDDHAAFIDWVQE